MLTEFENKVADFAKAKGLFDSTCGELVESTNKVLLAVSGGADSTALLYAMCALKAENILSAELICAHINHQLRGAEADLDEDFVKAESAKLNLAVITRRVDVRGFAHRNKLSIETAARKLRLDSLLDIAKANDCGCVATAHQKNDNAETILHRLSRGTGFRGLGGIWAKRIFADDIRFVRPLLCVGRDEIIEYLKKQNLKWRDDHTNVDCSYRRNFIRHRLLPALQQECSGSVVEQLFDLSGAAQRYNNLVCSEAEKTWPKIAEVSGETVLLNLKSFLAQPQIVKVELVRRSLTQLGSGEKNLTHRHYEKILQLAGLEVGGKKIELPNGFIVQREYENLFFAKPQILTENLSSVFCPLSSVVLEVPGQTQFGQYLVEAILIDAPITNYQLPVTNYQLTERFDIDKLKLPLVVRPRRAGDRFWPLGLAQEKKVGKFLTATKVPQKMRKSALIVTDSEKIIWLWPIRISEQAKITSDTRRILQLQITETEPP